ncbi:MAG: (Fe-S)-binding protein, partial [Desulfomonilia bacterium]|nr:(Fe-S)-binding protein [Desulfomonilia bacterium]
MYELVFDPELCLRCTSVDCIMRCQYISMDLDEAKREHDTLVKGEKSSILSQCVTCYACEEYCPYRNHPFYHIVEQQEKLGVHPIPIPIEKSQVVMMVPRGKIQPKEVRSPVIDMCFFSIMKGGI